MKDLSFHKALMSVWEIIGKVNKYIDSKAPWVLAKSDRNRLSTVIYNIAESLKIISALLWPFIPESAEKIQNQLGLPSIGKEFTFDRVKKWGSERPVRALVKAPALFPRIEDKTTKSKAGKDDKKMSEKKGVPLVSFEEFQKLDLRIGTVKKAEKIPGSTKLIKLTVDTGGERTVVAGIQRHYEEKDLIGKQVLLVVNLEPVKLMGVESHGMVLAASDDEGVHLLVPDHVTAPGCKVK
jgi:methionyl-tRNA synthetase